MRRWIGLVILMVLHGPVLAHDKPFPAAVLASVVTVLPIRATERPPRATPGDLRRQERSGSGVAIRPGGYIATNAHVIDGAREIYVRLADGRELPAKIVAQDAATDLAVIKVDAPLPALEMAPEPAIGAPVCGVGNPFGVGLSVTCGVVSAVRRTGMGFNPIEDFIQTDAVLNPGSSGGALVDGEGRLVGLVSAIFTRQSDANIGVNFAASTALLNRVVDDLLAHGTVRRVSAGWRLAPVPRAQRREHAGLRLVSVSPSGAAAKAGFETGDLITAIGGRAVRKRSDAITAVQLQRPGDEVRITYRRSGKIEMATLVFAP